MLEVKNLRKSYGHITATNDISLQFGETPGEVVFIVGPNGAGKTTLVNLITGLVQPDDGSVQLDGEDITGLSAEKRVHKGIAKAFQVTEIFNESSVEENLRIATLSSSGLTSSMFSSYKSHDAVETRVEELLEEFGLAELRDTEASELAHGQKKILDTALAFSLDPKYLILDEPTSGVATEEKLQVIDTVLQVSEERDMTTIVIEHDMDIVLDYADRLVVLHQGEVLRVDKPSIIETDQEIRETLLGITNE